ncbi:polar amino acid transport system substrate-binding protein [Desulfobaculum xiamenense]|uniref:histidine kinase n=1 Tax=Desulfobaculum xiamenense TaxID=995050 RepID=A0A846QSS4_9BACT|nr:transporter substrate-binding domain-containing protein [Desulfobaculum xiamenense]NJB68505.1 polar amino acid transport system substrate-binding protein [Desulfobaculum xiamenense]
MYDITRGALRLCVACLAVVFCAVLPPARDAFCSTNATAPERLTITIGGDLHYPPYEFLDALGEPNGFNVELSRALARVTGINVQIRLGLWQNMREALDKGEIDVLQGISHSAERAQKIRFSDPYTTVEYSIFAREDSPMAASLADMAGRAVLVEEGGAMFDMLRRFYPRISVSPAYNHENALRRLAAGHGDFALVSKTAGKYMIQMNGLKGIRPVGTPISLERYCYATTPDKEQLLELVNSGLEMLKANGTYAELCEKWLVVPEPDKISWADVFRYGALILVPLLLILVGSLVWSRMLQRKVAERTHELQLEIARHLEAKKELERKQKVIIHSDRMATLGVMASGIAHEINNPNGTMLMNLPIMLDSFEDALEVLDVYYEENGDFLMGGLPYSRMRNEIPQMLTDMMEGAQRIKHIVHDLKDFSRKGEQADMERLDMNHVVEASLRLVNNAIRKSTNAFTLSLGSDLPPVFGSSRRIQQVVVNLILNACQALPDTSRALTVATSYDEGINAVTLQVIDEGVGISAKHLDNITDPFFTTKRESGGTGLGLSVSAGIVKEHFGALDFESTPGKGTTVTLSLPAMTDDSEAGAASASTGPQPDGARI